MIVENAEAISDVNWSEKTYAFLLLRFRLSTVTRGPKKLIVKLKSSS